MNKQDWKERHSYHKMSGRRNNWGYTRRRRNNWLLAMLTLGMLVSVFTLNNLRPRNAGAPPQSSSVPLALPDAASIGVVVENFFDNRWGPETLDLLEGLLTVYAQRGEADVVRYLEMLRDAHSPEDADDTFLRSVCTLTGAGEAQIDTYRKALENAHLAKAG